MALYDPHDLIINQLGNALDVMMENDLPEDLIEDLEALMDQVHKYFDLDGE